MTTALWAPWRMDYLDGPASRTNEIAKTGCFFCDYAKLEPKDYRENLVLVTQPHALVCLNRYPFTTSHLLVAPRRHIGDLADLEPEEYAAMMTLLRESAIRLRQAVGCQGMNVGFNLGKAAGAGVPDHVHGHIVPRWNGDTNFLPVLADVRVMPEYLDTAWQRLRASFAGIAGVHPPGPEEP